MKNTEGYCHEFNLLHNTSCLGDACSFWASFTWLKHPLRIPIKLNLSNISIIKQLCLTIRLSLVCCLSGHMVVNTVRLADSQSNKINRPIFFWFQTVCNCKAQLTAEKNLSPSLRYDFGIVRNSCSSTSLKKVRYAWLIFEINCNL